jgi:uncharacterized membrane protein
MDKLELLWTRLRDSLWFVPTVLTLLGAGLAVLLVEMSVRLLGDVDRYELWWLLGDSSEGARGILSAIAGSLITVTGTVFSVTIIALQLTSQQFTPRVLRNFMADRSNQLVLGVLIGTFTYSLIVLRSVRASNDDVDALVPVLAVTGAMILALVSVGFLIYFIHHVAQSIQVSTIMANVARESESTIERLYRDKPADSDMAETFDDEPVAVPATAPRTVVSRSAGYIQAIEYQRIVKLAERHSMLVSAEVAVGDFVMSGLPLFSIWSEEAIPADVHDELRSTLVKGPDRTPYQDVEVGIVELVDIAVKAMSPSVNDPTTAIHALNRLGQILACLGKTMTARNQYRTADGRVILVLRSPTFDRAVELAFDQIRHFSADNAAVMEQLFNTITDVASVVHTRYWPPLADAAERALHAVEKSIDHPDDRARAVRAGHSALARCGRPTP